MALQVGDVVLSNSVTQFSSVAFTANHESRRVTIMSYLNEPVKFHIFGQHDNDPDLLKLKYHYPGLASSLRLPKLALRQTVSVLVFDKNNCLKLVKAELEEKLHFAHHHYAKYYTYGLVPVILKNFDEALYSGSPVFDETGTQLVSVICDWYFPKNDYCVIPLCGEMSGSRGVLCLDGYVWLNELGDNFDFSNSINSKNRIDLYVSYDKKFIYLNLYYNQCIITFIRIKAKFAGNVLIR
ncbi:P26B [Rachiplusia nu nucleopolyhedrovirus]|uniref:P26B n=1 Tax=Rachiplusia nu nucleopolyhedrovirus TaxID=2605775 RepID=A0AAE6M5N9_9ABAC|nr:P26B [Rachiplusia nu nucleopolyhedrovirus]QEI03606.1 P26B [Rachiplusia nu nucleopolyhedrovirus]